ncbi:DUF6414 family protein [Clostridium estertheticum]|uniref:Uncharacterized protein n=2 Tax=Clostridium estertheticum TaxID=238834 RepID=A0A1J0GK77_9CLOT|nr:hypothetical protein [Clostridium estertheticum]APC41780.1 hypothetical protein A7L45_17760 [Clostridium estertheticum subsp. estertheticum]MBU3073380.1 hypothetical protein [Clostridium estertheticum]MBU3163379.1 hypothetical protein [Clostridium estertheticum]MBU3185367.1 hypothetical protein [Clostridium estertheticum]MBZ9616331.1 hypothetical protein [Clostridium estertheticum subsp. laramiense]
MDNRALIPLYTNGDMINNLYTVVIEEFAEIKSESTRKLLTISTNTPLYEATCGKIMEGDLNVQFLNEFTSQKIEERVSIVITILSRLKNMLNEQNMLKVITSESDVANIKEFDFVQFTCELYKNPVLEYIEDIIRVMEMQLAFSPEPLENGDESEEHKVKRQVLKILKDDMEVCKTEKCIKFISSNIGDSNTKVIVPLEIKHMADNLDYIEGARITVLGKVVRIPNKNKTEINNNDLLSGTYFDYLNEEYFKEFKNRFLKDTTLINDYDSNNLVIDGPVIEIIPIAMYI